MQYKPLGSTDTRVSIIALGGHEYLPNKKSRGFNEDFEKAITPGYIFEGFGQENRRKVLATAFDHGVNFLDVTHDSEKEALGRNLREVVPPFPVYVQTRPEGFVYTYDPHNAKMADYALLKAEVVRILGLLRRERIEFFNLAFMKAALDHDPDYLAKIHHNVQELKREGLIQYACADTFSGEYTYLKQIDTGCFDAVYINFNFGDYQAVRRVLPEAQSRGLGVISREALLKGELFAMAREAGISATSVLANAALKWCLAHEAVTTVVYGTGNVDHLRGALAVATDPRLTAEEEQLIERIRATSAFAAFEARKSTEFLA